MYYYTAWLCGRLAAHSMVRNGHIMMDDILMTRYDAHSKVTYTGYRPTLFVDLDIGDTPEVEPYHRSQT